MIPRVTDELGTVSTLDDRPNDTGGLTAAELKAKFDADAGALKDYVNDVLIPFLEGTSAAASLGITTIPGFSADNIQTALEQIVQAMQDVTQGSVADGSITLAKLAEDVTAIALGGAAANHTHGADDIASGTLDSSRIPVLDGTKLGAGSVGTAQLGAAAVTAEKLAALAVLAQHIANGAVTTQKLAEGAVTAEKIADGAITPASIGALPLTGGTVSGRIKNTYMDGQGIGIEISHTNAEKDCGIDIRKESSDKSGAMFIGVGVSGKTGIYSYALNKWILYTDGTNLNIDGQQYRHIYAGTSDSPPSYWSNGDIYLQYE